jgi:hypothetical protein
MSWPPTSRRFHGTSTRGVRRSKLLPSDRMFSDPSLNAVVWPYLGMQALPDKLLAD